MAIRIRIVDNITIALCAAQTEAKEGDLYLDDSAHHALSTKFGLDWYSEGLIEKTLADKVLVDLMIKEGDKIKSPVELMVKKQNSEQITTVETPWKKYRIPNSMPCIKEEVLVKYKDGSLGLDYWDEEKILNENVIEFMRIP